MEDVGEHSTYTNQVLSITAEDSADGTETQDDEASSLNNNSNQASVEPSMDTRSGEWKHRNLSRRQSSLKQLEQERRQHVSFAFRTASGQKICDGMTISMKNEKVFQMVILCVT